MIWDFIKLMLFMALEFSRIFRCDNIFFGISKYGEIKENEYGMNIPRYDCKFEEEESVDIEGVSKDIEALEADLAYGSKEMVG